MRTRIDTVRAALGRDGWLGRRVLARVTVDSRALAAFRILLGSAILYDLLRRAQYLEMFYTNQGVYPLDALELTDPAYSDASIHAVSGAPWVQQALFLVAGLLAVAFVVGYRTRLVGLLSLALLFSLHGRNPLVLNGADRFFRVILLVSLATPLGERWSIDALRRGTARDTVAGFGTVALLCQPVAVFTANAAHKTAGTTWYAGDGLEHALKNDVMTVFLGDVLVNYPAVVTALNYVWLTLLAGSIVLLLGSAGRLRVLVVFVYLGAFAGMALSMTVGLFPLLLSISMTPFLAPPFWEQLARRTGDARSRLPSLPERVHERLARPPVERRLLAALRARGYESIASVTLTYARSLATVLGVLILAWVLLFTANDFTGHIPEAGAVDQQEWWLFAPNPSTSYEWYTAEATLANGSTVDALDGGTVTFERPAEPAHEYATFRHRKFMASVQSSAGTNPPGIVATSYADWVCRQARTHGRVDHVAIYRFSQHIDDQNPDLTPLLTVKRECQAP
jgi:hypothetical protein